MKRKSTQL